MAEITEIYKTINVLVSESEFADLRHSMGICENRNYVELDENDFFEYDDTIPYNIGKELYKYILNLFDSKLIDYVRIYNNEV